MGCFSLARYIRFALVAHNVGKLREFNENLEEIVKERTEEVEKLLRQKDEFINQLGHDLKSPLTPLIGLLPILEKTEDDPKSKEIVGIFRRNIEYMRSLVLKTLELAQDMIKIADMGDAYREDVGCGILFGIVRDSAFKIKKLAEEERQKHMKKGWWKEGQG